MRSINFLGRIFQIATLDLVEHGKLQPVVFPATHSEVSRNLFSVIDGRFVLFCVGCVGMVSGSAWPVWSSVEQRVSLGNEAAMMSLLRQHFECLQQKHQHVSDYPGAALVGGGMSGGVGLKGGLLGNINKARKAVQGSLQDIKVGLQAPTTTLD